MTSRDETRPLLGVNEEPRAHVVKSPPSSLREVISSVGSSLRDLGDPTVKSGAAGTMFSFMKLILGAGSFLLPKAFGSTGIAGGVLSLVLLAALTLYLTQTMIMWKSRLTPKQETSFAGFIAEVVPYRRTGKVMSTLMQISVLATSVGGCAVYGSFIGTVLSRVYCMPHWIYALGLAALAILFLMLQVFARMRYNWDPQYFLARTSVMGFLAAVGCAIATAFVGGSQFGILRDPNREFGIVWDGLPGYFGTAAFLYAITLFTFTPHNRMAKQRDFPKALVGGWSISTLFNASFGTIGYLIFGAACQDIATACLELGLASSIIGVLLGADIFFTYLVVIVPSSEIVRGMMGIGGWETLSGARGFFKALSPGLLIVVITTALAIFVPGIENLLGLVSAFGLTYSGLIAPVLVHLMLRRSTSMGVTILSWSAHLFILAFALAAGGYTVYLSFDGIITAYQGPISVFGVVCPNATSVNATFY